MRPAKKLAIYTLSICWMLLLAVSASAEQELFVSPEVHDRLNHSDSVELIIHFRDTPDLSPAYQMDWLERGRWVHDTMTAASRDAQSSMRSSLRSGGIDYKALESFNMMVVPQADEQVLQTLIADPQVRGIFVKPDFHLMGRELEFGDRSGPRGTEPNIDQIKASEVWDQLGITGENVVIGINDSPPLHTHDALVNQYRGTLGDGSFDHNYAWFDPITGSEEPPAEFHGTHVTGIAVGDDGADNQIGVAPGAEWMACGGFVGGADPEVLTCLDWFLAPTDLEGENPDPDLRPHVVNNSWGSCAIEHNEALYTPIFDAMYAAGVIPVVSNGNANAFGCQYPSPPGLGTVGDPARHGRVLGIGSTTQSGGDYAFHSNWGPTDNPNPGLPDSFDDFGYPDLKPNFSAPGEGIRSSVETGDSAYGFATGTSMASPHASGVIALMISAAPSLAGDFQNIGTILQETAIHVEFDGAGAGDPDVEPGVNHPNYAAGWGETDALAAVEAALAFAGPQGTLAGQVTNSDDSGPLVGVQVQIDNPNPPPEEYSAVTDAFGNYSRDVAITEPGEGTYTLTFSKFGFESAVVSDIEVDEDATTTVDVELDPAESWTVSGTVMDANTGFPLAGTIEIPGTPVDSITVGLDGQYSIELPGGMVFDFITTASANGYLVSNEEVGPLTEDTTFDIEVEADLVACEAPGYEPDFTIYYAEDFDADDGGFTAEVIGGEAALPWEWGTPVDWPGECTTGDNCWGTNLDGDYANSAHESLTSPVIDLSGAAGAEALMVAWDQANHVETNAWDQAYAEIRINGGDWEILWENPAQTVAENWRELDFEITEAAGETIEMRWRLQSDAIINFPGLFVDNLRVFEQECMAGDPPPIIDVSPDGFSYVVEPGTVEEEVITVRNFGGQELTYDIEFLTTSGNWTRSDVIWEQEVAGTAGIISSYSTTDDDGGYSADDFVLSTPGNIETILAEGFRNAGTMEVASSITWYIFADDNGQPDGNPETDPGAAVFTFTAEPGDPGLDLNDGNIMMDLVEATGSPVELDAGTYWLSVVPAFDFPVGPGDDRWNWYAGEPVQLENAKLISPELFGVGEWTDISDGSITGDDIYDALAFTLTGTMAGCDGTMPSWIELSETSGSVDPLDQDEIDLTVDTDGLANGTYQTELCFESNDPTNPLVLVPISVLVTTDPIQPVADINPENLLFNQVAGDVGSQTLNMGNTGNLPLDWMIEQDPDTRGQNQLVAHDRSGTRFQSAMLRDAHDEALDEDLNVPDFLLPGNGSVDFTIPGGVETEGSVIGITFEGTVSGISGTGTWASDMAMTLTSPAGDIFQVGGLGADSAWDFDGFGSTDDGTYSSVHIGPDVFGPDGTLDEGDWQVDFVHTWDDDMDWTDVTITLHKFVQMDACEEPSNVSWLDVNPTSGTTPAFDSLPVDVTVDSTGLAEGIHEASLCVTTNDPDNELVIVPVAVEVIDPANLATVEGTVASLGYCNDNPFNIAGASVEIVGDFNTFNTTTDADGFFQVEMHQQEGPVDVFVSADDHFDDSEFGVALAGETTSTVDFDLLQEVECATVAPESLEFQVVLGQTDDQTLTIGNFEGNVDLDWDLDHFESEGTNAVRNDPIVALDEDFEGAFPPADWTTVDETGECPWLTSDDYEMLGWVGSTRGAAIDTDDCGEAGLAADASLITPSLDLTGMSDVILQFDFATRHFSSGQTDVYLDVSTDGGDNWDTLEHWSNEDVAYPDDASVPLEFDLSAYDGEPDVQIRWRHVSGWDYWTYVNNVVVTEDSEEEPPPVEASCEDPNDVDWLGFDPADGTALAGDSSDVTIDVDTNGLEDGVYTATLCVFTSDENAELFEVPVSLTVDDPELATFTGTVSGQVCSEESYPAAGATITIESASDTFTTTADDEGFYFIKVHEDESPVDLTVSAPDHVSETTEGVSFVGLDVIDQDYTLAFDSACVDVDPAELTSTVPLDVTADEMLNIGNLGSQTLNWSIVDPAALQAAGLRDSDPLIGFNFTTSGSATDDPQNWNRISDAEGVLEDVMDDTGTPTGVDITWGGVTTDGFVFLGTDNVADDAVPQYDYDLSGMSGYGFRSDGDFFIELSGLAPNAQYEYWFVAYRSVSAIANAVTVSDGDDLEAIQFDQLISSADNDGRFVINDLISNDDQDWAEISFETTSSSDGTINFRWEGDGQTTVIGALAVRESLSCDIPDWLSLDPMDGSVESGDPADAVTATFNPAGLLPGVYEGQICVESNDPAEPIVEVPVTMNAEVPATWGSITGTVTSLGYCSDDPSVVEGAVVEIVSSEDTYVLETDESGFYEIYLPEGESPLSITASADNHLDESTNVAFSGGDEIDASLDLVLDEPCVSVTPESISVNIDADASTSGNILLGNIDGGALLNWNIDTADANLADLMRPDAERATSGDKSFLLDEAAAEGAGSVLSSGSISLSSSELADVVRPMSDGPNLSVDGVTTGSGYSSGDPFNSTLDLNIGEGNALIGIGWEITIEAFSPSWLSESRVAIVTNSGDEQGLFLTPGVGEDGPGIQDFSSEGILMLEDVDIPPIEADPSGNLHFEWFDSFTDFENDADSMWMDSANPLELLPGMRLICEDQAACDAAVSGEEGDDIIVACDDPEGISWLSATPSFGVTNVGDTTSITVALDATGVQPGEYNAGLCIASNDPVNPMVPVPVTMNVRIPSNWSTVEGTVDSLGYCSENPAALEGADIAVVGSDNTYTASTDSDGFYQVSLPASEAPVSVTVSHPAHIGESETDVGLSVGDTTVVDFSLTELSGCTDHDPESFSVTLVTGDSTGEMLTLNNIGFGDSDFTVTSVETTEEVELASVVLERDAVDARTVDDGASRVVSIAERPASVREIMLPASGTAVQVLVVSPDGEAGDPFPPTNLVDALDGFPDVDADLFEDPLSGITVDDLAPYDVVVTTNNNRWSDAGGDVSTGDALADFVDQGGKVVLFNFAFDWFGFELAGRYIDEEYGPFNMATADATGPVTMDILDPDHPIFDGVTSLESDTIRINVSPQPDAELIAEWSDGEALIAYNDHAVGFNALYSADGADSWTGDLDIMVYNAVQFLAGDVGEPAEWLSFDPELGTVPAEDSFDVVVGFDAMGLAAGTYEANILVTLDEGGETTLSIPATMEVIDPDPAILGVDPAELDFGEILVDEDDTLSFVVSNDAEPGAMSLPIDTIEASGHASFSVTGGDCEAGTTVLEPGQSCMVEVTFAPEAVGAVTGEVTVSGNGQEEVVDLAGEGFMLDPGELMLDPPSHDFEMVLIGSTATTTMTLINNAEAGSAAVVVDAIELVGDAAFVDTGEGSCEAGTTELEPEEYCTIEVAFTPVSEDNVATSLVVDGTEGKIASATLSGTGVEPTDELFHDRFEQSDD